MHVLGGICTETCGLIGECPEEGKSLENENYQEKLKNLSWSVHRREDMGKSRGENGT